MAENYSVRNLLKHLATLRFGSDSSSERGSDPFWQMIVRRLNKRKMEGTDKEGEPGPSSSAAAGAEESAALPGPSTATDPGQGRKLQHQYEVFIGDCGDRLDQMSKLQFPCPLKDECEDHCVVSEGRLASGDDTDRIMSSMSAASGCDLLRPIRDGKFSKIFLAKCKDPEAFPRENYVVFKMIPSRGNDPEDNPGSSSFSTPKGKAPERGSKEGLLKFMALGASGASASAPKRSRLSADVGSAAVAPPSQEAGIHCKMNHRNIVKMYRHVVDGGSLGIVMEWCQLGNVEDVIRKTCSALITEPIARRYFQQMVDAVDYVHQMGYVHRSVALRHFLLHHHDVIKLCDFSSADTIQNTEMNVPYDVGCPGYHPPEFMERQAYDPRQLDQWALGCCLFKMVTARLPFRNDGSRLLTPNIKLQFNNVAVVLSPDLTELLKGLLAILPEARFSMNRVKNSEWLKKQDTRAFIGNAHLVNLRTKTKPSVTEHFWQMDLGIVGLHDDDSESD